jgi:hypothetical protein
MRKGLLWNQLKQARLKRTAIDSALQRDKISNLAYVTVSSLRFLRTRLVRSHTWVMRYSTNSVCFCLYLFETIWCVCDLAAEAHSKVTRALLLSFDQKLGIRLCAFDTSKTSLNATQRARDNALSTSTPYIRASGSCGVVVEISLSIKSRTVHPIGLHDFCDMASV